MAKNGLPAESRTQLVVGFDAEVAEWVRRHLDADGFGPCTALGFAKDGQLIGGVVYHAYRPPNIEMSIATISPDWCSRKGLKAIFEYPFNQLGCKRVTALCDSTNAKAINLVERLGYQHEGTLRQGHPDGDAEIYGMLASECRWLISK